MPFWLGAAIVFVYGAVVGSFLNVLICRLPAEESIVFPASHCPKCKAKLKFWDLIPLLSFLALRRKCRYCGSPISWRYFGVELLTAAVFVGLYWRYQFRLEFFGFALLSGALIAAFFIDLEHWIIPDQISFFGMALGVVMDIAGLVAHKHELWRIPVPFASLDIPMLASIPSLVGCGGIFYVIAAVGEKIFKKEAMGGGDVKLAAAIGANLLFPKAMVAFFVAIFVGALIGVVLLVARRKSGKDPVPFGPMMVAGVFAVLLAYPQLQMAWRAWQNMITGAMSG